LSDGSVAQDGYQALKDLDSNADNVLDAQDTAFASLQVWVDADTDGVTDAGELKSLRDLQIQSLDLQAKASQRTDQGNLVGLVSGYQTQDGATHEMADVWLQVSEEPLSTVSQLTQALAELSEQADAGSTQVKLDDSALLEGMASTGSTATTMAQALAHWREGEPLSSRDMPGFAGLAANPLVVSEQRKEDPLGPLLSTTPSR
jgi:hypothetical protein